MESIIELTPIEQEIDVLIGKSNFYLQTYRAIDAQNVLKEAMRLVESKEVKWQMKAIVYRNMGDTLFRQGHANEAMDCFIKSYDVIEDDNDKAAAVGLIAGYYLWIKKNKAVIAALDYIDEMGFQFVHEVQYWLHDEMDDDGLKILHL